MPEISAEAMPDPVEIWDRLWRGLMFDIVFIGAIFAAAALYLLIKYRRGNCHDKGNAPRLSAAAAIGWAVIPAIIFLADDLFLAARNFELWNVYRNVPANAYVIELKSAMWSWSFAYPEGITAANELRVPAGRPVMLKMTSRDVVHSLFIPDFRIKEDSMPGRTTYLWFYPKKPGEHVITCAEYCGVLHSGMHGKVIVMPSDEFFRWIKEGNKKEPL